MEARPQATFIPKKPVTSNSIGRKGIGFLSLISLVIFLATVAVSVGMYFYKDTLVKSIAAKESELEEKRKIFDPQFTKSIVDLSTRIEVSKKLLEKHVAVSSLFDTLQKDTLKTVQITDFTFGTGNTSGAGSAGNSPVTKISISGLARDYNSLAFQAETYAKNPDLKNQTLSNFSLTDKGGVSFSFEAEIDADLIDYGISITGAAPRVPVSDEILSPVATSTTATTTSTSTNTRRP